MKIFYSYSHKDVEYTEELRDHLSILKRNGDISEWCDQMILPGDDWKTEIDENLESADIVLLLVSSNFLASDFCFDVELKQAILKHEKGQARVVPIILKHCEWKDAPFGELQALPSRGVPVESSKWINRDEAYHDVIKGIKNAISKLTEKGTASKRIIDSNDDDLRTTEQAIRVYKQEASRLGFNSDKEAFDRVEKLKKEIFDSLFSEVDEKIKNIPKVKDLVPESLFDRIIFSETLEEIEIQRINEIRDDRNSYSWYHRAIVVPAITISIIRHSKFDRKKIHLLLDFLSDFEKGVWERALCGIVIALLYRKNKWQRYVDVRNRLNAVQEIQKVQLGLRGIEIVLRNKLYQPKYIKANVFDQYEFFDTIVNWFKPFHDNNEIFKYAVENTGVDLDVENFGRSIKYLPFVDSIKYYTCLWLGQQDELQISETDATMERASLQFLFQLSRGVEQRAVLGLFQNILVEYFLFFKYFSLDDIENVFDYQLSLSNSKLKDFVLSRIHSLMLYAENMLDKGKFSKCIEYCDQVIEIDSQNYHALYLKALSHKGREEYSEAIEIFNLLKEVEDIDRLKIDIRIGSCLMKMKKYEDVLDIFLPLVVTNNREAVIFQMLGNVYSRIGENEKAVQNFEEAEKLDLTNEDIIDNIYWHYHRIRDNSKALLYAKKKYKLNPNSGENLNDIATLYLETGKYEEANDLIKLGVEKFPEYTHLKATKARYKLLVESDISGAKKILLKLYKKDKGQYIVGNLAEAFLCEKKYDKAKELYKLAAKRLKEADSYYLIEIDLERHIENYSLDINEVNDIRAIVREILV